ncbi:MAG TPA: nuclear transport factor 2 family protein [Terracidiphilus sp.]|jgi:ketosteroid isomerase-like protein
MKNSHRLVSHVLTFAVLLVGSSLIIAQSGENESNRVTKEITRLEDRWLNAIQTADVAALDQIIADDFVRPAPAAGEFITKAQFLAYYRAQKPAPSTASTRIENLSVKDYGNTAIARGIVVNRDANGHILSRNLFTDVFVIRDGRWHAVSAQENALTNAHSD